ncbi:MAG: DUF4350 domain-containing protein [Pirellulaceae bacterium]|nr:DUF4350 domain-containing protein [Pirellulaceae bacterium]
MRGQQCVNHLVVEAFQIGYESPMVGYQKRNSIKSLCTLFVCSLIVCSLFVSSCWAQASPRFAQQSSNAPTESGWHFGFDLLQMLLEDRGLQVSGSLESALAAPKQSVIVISGSQPSRLMNNLDRLIEFVMNGGTLLLASDNSLTLPGIGRFSRGPVTSNDPLEQYQGFNDCLRIVPQANTETFTGVAEIVTNRAGWFEPDSVGWLEWQVLASFPADCRPIPSRNNAVLAVGRWATDQGVAVMSADAGLFSNGMMWHGDNAIAAIRVSELLCEGGKKTQLAFLVDGQVMDSYRNRIDLTQDAEEPTEGPPVPEPELQKAFRLANAIAKEVAESNVINEALRQRPRGVQPSRYFRAFLYVVAVMILIAILWALLASGTVQALFLAPRKMRSAYDMREHASNLADDFRNSAGFLARDFCWELTGSRNTADWQRYLASLMANINLSPSSLPNGLILTKVEQHELMRIIDIACRGCHTRMSSQEFQLLGNSINKLRSKHRTQPLVAV